MEHGCCHIMFCKPVLVENPVSVIGRIPSCEQCLDIVYRTGHKRRSAEHMVERADQIALNSVGVFMQNGLAVHTPYPEILNKIQVKRILRDMKLLAFWLLCQKQVVPRTSLKYIVMLVTIDLHVDRFVTNY